MVELVTMDWRDRIKSLYPVPDFIGRRMAIDIGANVGGFPLAYHSRFDHIICVEPCSDTFKELVNNTAHLKNVHCLNLAVGYVTGDTVTLRRHREHPDKSSCFSTQQHDEWGEAVGMCPVIDLHHLLEIAGCDVGWPTSSRISYLKVDCEGAEFDILNSRLHRCIDAIAVELHAQWPDKCAALKERLEQFYDEWQVTITEPHENIVYVHKGKK